VESWGMSLSQGLHLSLPIRQSPSLCGCVVQMCACESWAKEQRGDNLDCPTRDRSLVLCWSVPVPVSILSPMGPGLGCAFVSMCMRG